MPYFAAIADSVSPLFTVYVVPLLDVGFVFVVFAPGITKDWPT